MQLHMYDSTKIIFFAKSYRLKHRSIIIKQYNQEKYIG
jgi:hypothetical protein